MIELNMLGYAEDGIVANVVLNGKVNAEFIKDLHTICAHIEDTSKCDIIVFREGKNGFTGGIDLKDFNPEKPLDIHGFHRWEKALRWIERLDRLTIALIEGRCIGAGMQIALVCDLRLASKKALLGFDEIKLGFLPGMATWRLAKYVGLGRARALTAGGRILNGIEAEDWGLIDHAIGADDLHDTLQSIIRDSQPVHRIAIELNRRLLNESYAIQYEDAIGNLLAAQHRAIISEPFQKLLTETRRGGRDD